MLEGTGVTRTFGGLTAVNKVDFFVGQGEVVGLIGPNGAGKTTLFNLISGALPLRSGEIRFKGEDITGLGPEQIFRRGLGRTFQTAKLLYGMTVFENLRLALLYGNPDRRFRYKEAEREVNHLVASLGMLSDRNKPARDITLAGQRRLEIARAVAGNAELLLLDEVMAGLNPDELDRSIELITGLRGRGITIFMIEHVMHAIMKVCDRIIVLHEGRNVAEGTPAEVAANPTVRAIYLGS